MSADRELIVLGTASQAPTRHRNHNGYFLRWDREGVLFDPGEGTQRQLLLAGIPATAITRICITHLHGDHSLGLAGVVQRLSLDRVTHRVTLHYPAAGARYVDRLCRATIFDLAVELDHRPVPHQPDGTPHLSLDMPDAPFRLVARTLDHRVDTVGWRIEEPDGRRMLPERLAELGITGPDVGRLQRDGRIRTAGDGEVALHEVSEHRPGQRFAFVMDTRVCQAAVELARDADLLVCESTFLEAEAHLAHAYAHLTAAQAARIAVEAGAHRMLLTHFSQRHPDEQDYLDEAAPLFPAVLVARDLDRIEIPRRR